MFYNFRDCQVVIVKNVHTPRIKFVSGFKKKERSKAKNNKHFHDLSRERTTIPPNYTIPGALKLRERELYDDFIDSYRYCYVIKMRSEILSRKMVKNEVEFRSRKNSAFYLWLPR